ncbi:MAG: Rieske (2Fe-2S) protein [bacterium]|nr:Rieske (2Fe-2S) protein [bacterium]
MAEDYGDYQLEEALAAGPEASRGFSRRSLLSIGWIASLVSLIGPGLANIRYLFPNVLYETPTTFKLRKPAEYPDNAITFDEERRLFIFRGRLGFRAMSAVCTHLRCTIGPFGPSGRRGKGPTSLCPCHGSVFDTEGRVLSGPAPRPLAFFRLSMSPDERLQVDTQALVASDTYFKV